MIHYFEIHLVLLNPKLTSYVNLLNKKKGGKFPPLILVRHLSLKY